MRAILLVVVAACTPPVTPPPPHPVVIAPAEPTVPPHCARSASADCRAFGYSSGEASCTPEGDVDITRCLAGDPHAPSRRSPACGNGRIDTAREPVCAPCMPGHSCPCENVQRRLEACDGDDLDGKSCTSLGYRSGRLACSASCTLDTSRCSSLALDHPWQDTLVLPGLAGLSTGTTVHATMGATTGAVGVAWVVHPSGVSTSGSPIYQAVFAWSDPSLRVLRTSKPFPAGYAGSMQLGGNNLGWLLAIATYGDNPGPGGPGVTVYPISRHGHVARPGRKVDHQEALFLVRGAGSEPSLVGALSGFLDPGQGAMWALDGWFVDEHGEPLTQPFRIGTPVLTYSTLGAKAAYLGNGAFVVARGSTRDPAIELSIVDTGGNVRVLPVAHPDLAGMPAGLLVTPARIELVFYTRERLGAMHAAFTADGRLVAAPRPVTDTMPVGLISGPTVVGVVKSSAWLHPLAGAAKPPPARPLAAMPMLYIPTVADAIDASYALMISAKDARIVRLR